MSSDPRLTRRAVLLGSLAVPLAACRPHRPAANSPGATVTTADADALRQALADEEQLLITLRALADLDDVREQEQGVHAEHVIALREALDAGRANPPAGGPGPAATSAGNVAMAHKKALQARFDRQRRVSAHRLGALSLAASDGTNAALFASIAACHSAWEASDGGQFLGGRS